ncbi:MAG: FlgO family outer membrane protein [Alphaproteobacteria bacterium]|nr:FlgO family outer membrane protein [Alphaproteobacteria bacterium]
MERRLAAIVAIDVAGYSRLMGGDEAGTLARLKDHRDATMPIGERHGGRVVGTAGDGELWEFPSVIEAVASAIEVQAVMAARNSDIPDDEKMLFRIGINLGDVLVEGEDIYGDGVNVAARIEALAEPGGICLARAARDQVRDRMEIALEDLGEVEVKNIARPVRVFRVRSEGEDAPAQQAARPWLRYAAVAIIIVAVIAGGTGWWWLQQPDFEPADQTKLAYALPKKPSIAVLPFDNLSGDPKQDYLGDGLTENIIAVLSATSPELLVIARNSTFTFKGKPTKVQEVAEKLGVRYVLEGSVQKDGNKVRITAQLVDAIDGKHLWSEVYDRKLDNLFAIQDEIASRIMVEMHVKLTYGETTRQVWESIRDPNVLRIAAEGGTRFQTYSKDGNRDALRLFKEALKIQPENPFLTTYLGWTYWQSFSLGFSGDRAGDLRKIQEYGERSLALDKNYPGGHLLLATTDVIAGKHASASARIDKIIEVSPHSIFGTMGWIKYLTGEPAQAVVLLERLMRVQPFHFQWVPEVLASSHLALGQYDRAGEIYRGILASPATNKTVHPDSLRGLIALSVFKNDMEAARRYTDELLKLRPDSNVAAARRSLAILKDQAFVARYLDALRQAGIPDFAPVDQAKMAYKLPEKPSIAVLPFRYLGGDKAENGYLAEGLSENIVSALGHISNILVIDWKSSRALKVKGAKGHDADIRKTAEKFGVQYVLTGSMQLSGKKLRVTAQLADATNGRHLWSETYDRDLAQIFKTQDDITKEIAAAMNAKFGPGEDAYVAAASTKNLKAWKLYLQAGNERRKYTAEGNAKALELHLAAEKEDPNFVVSMLERAAALALAGRFSFGEDSRAALAKAMDVADKAVRIDPKSGLGLAMQGWLDLWRGKYARAVERTELALSRYPNSAGLNSYLGMVHIYSGNPEDALAAYGRAERLRGSQSWAGSWHRVFALVNAGRHAEALTHIAQYEKRYRFSADVALFKALALAALEKEAEAEKAVKALLKKKPDISARERFDPIRQPYADDWAFKTYAPILEKLGLPRLTEPKKPAIAVLPFANLSDDKEQEYFADGMTDDLITDLSKLSGLVVIARNSVFTYKGKAVKVQEVAKDLNVTHVLEGSVRRAGGKVRINAQLIDAKTGAHLWADKFDRDYADIFALQDEVTARITAALKIKLTKAEKTELARIPTKNLEAYELYLQARTLQS